MLLRLRMLVFSLALGLAAPFALASPPDEPAAAPAAEPPAAPAAEPAAVPAAEPPAAPAAEPPTAPAPDPTLLMDEPAYEPLDVDVNEIARSHSVRIGIGFATPMHLGGLSVKDRERVFEDGAVDGDSAVHGSGSVGYRRGLLDVRLVFSGKTLSLADGNGVIVDDGVQDQLIAYRKGGGYLSIAALAGVSWEPTLYTAAGGNEGLTLALSALGGFEHISLWGSFRDERIPDYRHPEQSFHWVVERQRFDAELAFRWRHFVGGKSVRHLLGIEAGVAGSLLVHIPGLAYASDAIAGAKDLWWTWTIFVRLSWEMGLPAGA